MSQSWSRAVTSIITMCQRKYQCNASQLRCGIDGIWLPICICGVYRLSPTRQDTKSQEWQKDKKSFFLFWALLLHNISGACQNSFVIPFRCPKGAMCAQDSAIVLLTTWILLSPAFSLFSKASIIGCRAHRISSSQVSNPQVEPKFILHSMLL